MPYPGAARLGTNCGTRPEIWLDSEPAARSRRHQPLLVAKRPELRLGRLDKLPGRIERNTFIVFSLARAQTAVDKLPGELKSTYR
jgi:hypothetical protein